MRQRERVALALDELLVGVGRVHDDLARALPGWERFGEGREGGEGVRLELEGGAAARIRAWRGAVIGEARYPRGLRPRRAIRSTLGGSICHSRKHHLHSAGGNNERRLMGLLSRD